MPLPRTDAAVPAPPGTARPAAARRARAVVLLVVLALVTLTGCTRAQVALAVQPDDTVDGTVTVATPDGAPGGKGPQLTVPEDLQSQVDVSSYDQDGYVGSTASFSGLSFAEVSKLNALGGSAAGRANMEMRRVGERILVQGRADLTTMPVDKADVRLAISFPGEVVGTDGEAEGGTVSWNFSPGKVSQFNAQVVATDPHAPSVLGWTLLLVLLVLVAAGAAVFLARRDRNPPVHS
ncbi:LppM family (lipo)protein [Pseudonocardia phyllosphaerae]|uniref:LppM family (lipo)protein n=1 Tax=Pseudonocardia phyllosphaerae TaxID=3390502 RepID=UPI00397D1683